MRARPDRTAEGWRKRNARGDLAAWWKRIEDWRGRDCFAYKRDTQIIKPQYALERLYALTRERDVYITTEVGQHQMWAAQYFHFDQPNRWMTSGGLGTMGYGLPAAFGVQAAHPDALVIDIAGEASVQMTMQEMCTAVQHNAADQGLHPEQRMDGHGAPVAAIAAWRALFALLLRGVAGLREARRSVRRGGIARRAARRTRRCDRANDRNAGPGSVDCRVARKENCFPMIPSGKAHNEMILADDIAKAGIDDAGRALV